MDDNKVGILKTGLCSGPQEKQTVLNQNASELTISHPLDIPTTLASVNIGRYRQSTSKKHFTSPRVRKKKYSY